MLDPAALAEITAEMVKGYVDRTAEPLVKRIEALEAVEIPTAINGQDGRDGVDGRDGEPGEPGEKGADGRDADEEAIKAALTEHLEGVVKAEVERATASTDPVLTDEERAAIASMLLRKELGEGPIIDLPEAAPHIAPVAKAPQPIIVKVDVPQPRKGVEKTVVTKHDERGRIVEFERHEV